MGTWARADCGMLRRRLVMVGLLLSVMAVGACERPGTTPAKDTAVPVSPPPESTTTTEAPPPPAAWDSSAGLALIVPAETPHDAHIIVPAFTEGMHLDSVSYEGQRLPTGTLDLFARGHAVGRASIISTAPAKNEADCTTWPTAVLAPDQPGATIAPWTVAFSAGRAEIIPVDSIEGLPRPDSARLAADVARLASALPNDTAKGLRGLPFIVKTVRRFKPDSGSEMLVAEVIRRLNEEANPREEQIFLVAERDSTGPYVPVHLERASGAEESLTTTDVLAVVRLGAARRLTLVLAREFGEGVAYSLLQRTSARVWRVRWTSAYAGC
jgi:hypothetical protein